MSSRTGTVPAHELEPGQYVGYLSIGTTVLLPATVVRVDVVPGGMHRVTVRLVLTGGERHVWCTPAAAWPVELPPTYADRAVPAPVFGCRFKNADDGCCNAPDWSSAECWVAGADREMDRLLEHAPGDEITWAPCPLVPYPDRTRP